MRSIARRGARYRAVAIAWAICVFLAPSLALAESEYLQALRECLEDKVKDPCRLEQSLSIAARACIDDCELLDLTERVDGRLMTTEEWLYLEPNRDAAWYLLEECRELKNPRAYAVLARVFMLSKDMDAAASIIRRLRKCIDPLYELEALCTDVLQGEHGATYASHDDAEGCDRDDDGDCDLYDDCVRLFDDAHEGKPLDSEGRSLALRCCPMWGACCFEDYSCESRIGTTCVGEGTRFLPERSCTPNPCTPRGACCLPDGTCETRIRTDCPEGRPFYPERDCSPDLCERRGACCLQADVCESRIRADCPAGRRFYPERDCSPHLCWEPRGACCLPEGGCRPWVTRRECAAFKGEFRRGETCPCDEPVCCIECEGCEWDLTEAECRKRVGKTRPDCPRCPEGKGACRHPDGCEDNLTERECKKKGGEFRCGKECPRGSCCLHHGECAPDVAENVCNELGGVFDCEGGCEACEPPGSWELGVRAGFFVPDKDFSGKDHSFQQAEPLVGVRAGYRLNDRWSLFTDGEYSDINTDVEPAVEDSETWVLRAGAERRYRPPPHVVGYSAGKLHFRCFFSFGGGWMRFDIQESPPGVDDPIHRAFGSVSFGQIFYPRGRPQIRWEIRGDQTFTDDGFSGDTITNLHLVVGVTWSVPRRACSPRNQSGL